jgi:hypothetical protein
MLTATSASSRETQCVLNVTACHLYALRPSFLLVRDPTMLTVIRAAMVSAAARPIACSHQIICSVVRQATKTMANALIVWCKSTACAILPRCNILTARLCCNTKISHTVISVTCKTEKSPAEVHLNLALHWSEKVLQAKTTCWLHRWWT